MSKKIVEQWDIGSHSDPTKTYKVTLYDDDSWACSCPAWIYRRQVCKHIQEAQSLLASSKKQEKSKEKVEPQLIKETGLVSLDLQDIFNYWIESNRRLKEVILLSFGISLSEFQDTWNYNISLEEIAEEIYFIASFNNIKDLTHSLINYRNIDYSKIKIKDEDLKNWWDQLHSSQKAVILSQFHHILEIPDLFALSELTKKNWKDLNDKIKNNIKEQFILIKKSMNHDFFSKSLEAIKKMPADISKNVKEKEWDLSGISDSIQKGLIRTDIQILIENLKGKFKKPEDINHSFDKDIDVYKIIYYSDPEGLNDNLMKQIDKLALKIIKREITVANLMANIEKITVPSKKPKKPEEAQIKFITLEEIDKISTLWSNLSNGKIKTLLTYIGLFSQVEAKNHKKVWDNISESDKKEIVRSIKEMSKLTEGLKFSHSEYQKVYIAGEDIESYWNKLTKVLRTQLLLKLDWVEAFAKDDKNIDIWKQLEPSLRDKIKNELIQLREILFSGLHSEIEKSQEKKKSEKELQALYEQTGKKAIWGGKETKGYIKWKEETKVISGEGEGEYSKSTTKEMEKEKALKSKSKKLSDEEILENNILMIICDSITAPNSQYDSVIDKYIFACLLGDEKYPAIRYTSADFKVIGDKLYEMVDKRILTSSSNQRGDKTFYKPYDDLYCSKNNFTPIPTNLNLPILEEFPNIKEDDISKRVILQILCMYFKNYNKLGRMKKFKLLKQFLNFFEYSYKPYDKSREYHYLIEDLGLINEADRIKHFEDELKQLLNRNIIVSYPATYYSKDETITLQADYKWLWKTYKLGVFSDYQELTDCSKFVNKDKLKTDNFFAKRFENMPEEDKLVYKLLEKYPRFYILGKNFNYPAYLIYNYQQFELLIYYSYNSDFKSFNLGFDKKIFRTEIFKILSEEYEKIENITQKQKNQWLCYSSLGKITTFSPLIKF